MVANWLALLADSNGVSCPRLGCGRQDDAWSVVEPLGGVLQAGGVPGRVVSSSPGPPSTCPGPRGPARVHRIPREFRRQIWSTNPQERLNKEIRRRTDVVGTFPDRASVLRLVGAVLAETHDEWADTRRYMTVDALLRPAPVTETEELLLEQAA